MQLSGSNQLFKNVLRQFQMHAGDCFRRLLSKMQPYLFGFASPAAFSTAWFGAGGGVRGEK
jgi:hypothetical protein